MLGSTPSLFGSSGSVTAVSAPSAVLAADDSTLQKVEKMARAYDSRAHFVRAGIVGAGSAIAHHVMDKSPSFQKSAMAGAVGGASEYAACYLHPEYGTAKDKAIESGISGVIFAAADMFLLKSGQSPVKSFLIQAGLSMGTSYAYEMIPFLHQS